MNTVAQKVVSYNLYSHNISVDNVVALHQLRIYHLNRIHDESNIQLVGDVYEYIRDRIRDLHNE